LRYDIKREAAIELVEEDSSITKRTATRKLDVDKARDCTRWSAQRCY